MQEHQLPTWNVVVQHALNELDHARRNMSAARDWLNSDWAPISSPLPDAAVDARRRIFTIIGTIKGQIDEAKGLLWDATTDT